MNNCVMCEASVALDFHCLCDCVTELGESEENSELNNAITVRVNNVSQWNVGMYFCSFCGLNL